MSFKRKESSKYNIIALTFVIVFILMTTIVLAEDIEPLLVDAWLDHYYWYGTNEDSIENVELEWSPSRSIAVAGLHQESAEVHNPKFVLETDMALIGFNPDDEEVFTAYPDEGLYIWDFQGLVVKEPESCVVHFFDDEIIHQAKTRFSASRSVVPETLTDEITEQTVTLIFTLEEDLPETVNSFGVWIGSSIIAYEEKRLVTSEIVGQNEVAGWESGTDGIQACWHIEPNDITVGETYIFEATIEATKSEQLLGTPLFKPGILIGRGQSFPVEEQIGTSVVIEAPDSSVKATISNDNELRWSPIYGELGYDFWFNEKISEIIVPPDKEPPPYYVLIPAEVEIKPKTLKLKSRGVFTAYVQLPPPYSVYDIDISTVVCEGAEAIRGSIEDDILTLQFWRQDLHDVESGEEVEFMIIGALNDGTLFEGRDTIRVLE